MATVKGKKKKITHNVNRSVSAQPQFSGFSQLKRALSPFWKTLRHMHRISLGKHNNLSDEGIKNNHVLLMYLLIKKSLHL